MKHNTNTHSPGRILASALSVAGALPSLLVGLSMLSASPSAQAASDTWDNGADDNLWQSAANWVSDTQFPGLASNVFTNTDTATFGSTGGGTIDLGGVINVGSINFNADAGAFVIGDANDTLNITGTGTNTTGGAFIAGGATASQQIGSAGTTINISGTNTNFNNASTVSGVTLTLAGNIGHTVAGNTNLFLGSTGAVAAGGNVTVSGNITSETGTIALFKGGTNTATLSGTTTTNGGGVTVRAGTLNIDNTLNAGGGGIIVSDNSGSGNSATLNIAANVTALNMSVNGAAARSGAVYQTSGTVTLTQGAAASNFVVGNFANPTQGTSGYYKLSGGSLTANEFAIGGNVAGSVGVMDVTAGTATSNGYIVVGRGTGTSSGLLNVTGGAVNATRIELNWANATGAISTLNVGGGIGAAAVSTTGSATLGVNLANSSTVGTQGVVNLLANGTLTTGIVTAGQANPTTAFNFNGGTLKATATNAGANFLGNANIDAVNVYSGGGTIDNSGTGITVGKALVAPAGYGVSDTTVSVAGGGSGYIGAPLVKLTGGTGTGATGYATISDGKVTGITITSAGTGYTAGDTLTATFYGGVEVGGTVATAVTGITVAANTSGGMTFSGSGTTTLSAANTYTGATTVSQGTLALGATGSLASTAYTIANGATFNATAKSAYDLSSVSTTIGVGATTAGFFNGPTGALTLGNSLTLNFSTSLIADGQTYNLFDFGSRTGNFSSVNLMGSIIGTLDRTDDTWTGNAGGYDFTFSEASGVLSVATAVPEPSTYAVIFGSLALAATTGVRRRKA